MIMGGRVVFERVNFHGSTSHHGSKAPAVEQAKELAERKCPPGGMAGELSSAWKG